MKLTQFLKENGIRTNADLNDFVTKNRRTKVESKYAILVRVWGEPIADKVMRLLEVAEWDLSKGAITRKW